jgi:hypothetical protein
MELPIITIVLFVINLPFVREKKKATGDGVEAAGAG